MRFKMSDEEMDGLVKKFDKDQNSAMLAADSGWRTATTPKRTTCAKR